MYVPAGQDSVTLDLSALAGPAAVSFYNSRTGAVDSMTSLEGGGFRAIAIPDSSQDWALLLVPGAAGRALPDASAAPGQD